MRGVKADELVAIIDFLYFGEANVSQESLDAFLALDEELKLKGLTGSTEHNNDDLFIKAASENNLNRRNNTQNQLQI